MGTRPVFLPWSFLFLQARGIGRVQFRSLWSSGYCLCFRPSPSPNWRRHPLYLGYLLFLLGLPLWLESSAGALVLPLVFAPVVARIFVEERTLRGILPGYEEYMNKVRFRLVPCVW